MVTEYNSEVEILAYVCFCCKWSYSKASVVQKQDCIFHGLKKKINTVSTEWIISVFFFQRTWVCFMYDDALTQYLTSIKCSILKQYGVLMSDTTEVHKKLGAIVLKINKENKERTDV